MKVAAIVKPLDEFTKWFAGHKLTVEAAAIQQLAVFLKEHERKNVSDTVASIRTSRLQVEEAIGSPCPTALGLREMRDLLACIAGIADSLGGKSQAGDFRALAEVLAEEPASSSSIATAVVQIRTRLARVPTGRRRQSNSPARRKQQATPSAVSVDEYVRKLEAATEVADISSMFQEFRDRSFRKAKLEQIAHRFAKGPGKYKSKDDAIEDIEGRFHQRRRAANEIDFLERKKVTPW